MVHLFECKSNYWLAYVQCSPLLLVWIRYCSDICTGKDTGLISTYTLWLKKTRHPIVTIISSNFNRFS